MMVYVDPLRRIARGDQTMTANGVYQIASDGCDLVAVRIRDGRVVGMVEMSMLDTLRAARDPRAEWLQGDAEEMTEGEQDEVLRATYGDDVDPYGYAVGRVQTADRWG